MQHQTAVTYIATVSNDAISRIARNGRAYTAFGVAILSDSDRQFYHYNVVAFGQPGAYAKGLRRGAQVKLTLTAESQTDNDAAIPLLTAVFVKPVQTIVCST
jgi:hypothetical protein